MRKPLVAGNWKMNKKKAEAFELVENLRKRKGEMPESVEVMIAPPAIYLSEMASNADPRISIGAQDVSEHPDQGAYTGELSAEMLISAGVPYAIVGHSERRSYHGETDEVISEKIAACTNFGVVPVYCCGESLDERESNRHFEVVKKQVTTALKSFSPEDPQNLVIAYEPVWAIGTGKTASAEQAQEMHAEIRKVLIDLFGKEFASDVRILYGGSVKPGNAREIFAGPDVDGGLIGGASLNADDFISIVAAAD